MDMENFLSCHGGWSARTLVAQNCWNDHGLGDWLLEREKQNTQLQSFHFSHALFTYAHNMLLLHIEIENSPTENLMIKN